MPSETGLCFAGPKNRGCKANAPTTRPCGTSLRFAEFVYALVARAPSAESVRSPGGLADALLESSVWADEGQRTVDRIRIYLLSHAQV